MFITALVVLFIIKLRFPKGKSIHHIIYISCHAFSNINGRKLASSIMGNAVSSLRIARRSLIFRKKNSGNKMKVKYIK